MDVTISPTQVYWIIKPGDRLREIHSMRRERILQVALGATIECHIVIQRDRDRHNEIRLFHLTPLHYHDALGGLARSVLRLRVHQESHRARHSRPAETHSAADRLVSVTGVRIGATGY